MPTTSATGASTPVAPTVTPIALSGVIEPMKLRDALKARGILTAAGLGPYESLAFRIGHMGDIRLADLDRTLAAIADVLAEHRA